MKTAIIIPARLDSTRLAKKALKDINGELLIERVYKQAIKSKKADAVYIATDSEEIRKACSEFTDNVFISSKDCASGSDRVADLAKEIDADVVMNVQGDEPFIDPLMLDELFGLFDDENVYMASAMTNFTNLESFKNPNSVKVIVDKDNYALYFSRAEIPYFRGVDNLDSRLSSVFHHIGVYAFKNDFLQEYTTMPTGVLEEKEKLEQLRVLENGFKIKMLKTKYFSLGVDTEEDLFNAINYAKQNNL